MVGAAGVFVAGELAVPEPVVRLLHVRGLLPRLDRIGAPVHVGRDVVLVGVCPKDVGVIRLAYGLEYSEARSVGILKNDIDSARRIRSVLASASAARRLWW